jgi:pimeloyl-ACP methyl ester carboxylesterase
MRATTLMSILFFLCCNTSFAQEFDYSEENKIDVKSSNGFSTKTFVEQKEQNIIAQNSIRNTVHLPYPILFVHGLCSSSATWDTLTTFLDIQYGLTFGGRFDFCLNGDSDNSISNLDLGPILNADIVLFSDVNQLQIADYYTVNFDVGFDGIPFPGVSDVNYVLSNQAAVSKQGVALREAIYWVLQKTGKQKVILMGHSMGGLASREYIQNPNLWQSDGAHHIAKLVTTGTPHGGSNAGTFELLDYLASIDDQSDAVRDLRTSYYYSEAPGVYLFGGLESDSVMNDLIYNYFYNVDVNSNQILGENVVGLNQKSIITDLDYACIVGMCDCTFSSPGDGIVSDISADINNFYPGLTSNLFYYHESAISEIHSSLPGLKYENMQGLDEPNQYALAYRVDFNTTYTGFNTIQSDWADPIDYDYFRFSVAQLSNVTISISSIVLPDLMAQILDLSGNAIGTIVHSSGGTTINFTELLNIGDYYLQISGAPSAESYLSPYNFILTEQPITTGISDLQKYNRISIYPNPTKNTLLLETLIIDKNSFVKIVNCIGQTVYKSTLTDNKTVIDCSLFSKGVYTVEVKTESGFLVKKMVKE